MSTSFRGFTIHEGYNDIGDFKTDITHVERPVFPQEELVTAPPALDLLFKFNFLSGDVIPQDYTVDFTVKTVATETAVYTLHPDGNGYIKVRAPLFPVVKIAVATELQPKLVRIQVTGPLTERSEECYMKVVEGSETYYTLIKDICVYDGFLCIYNGTNYYKIEPEFSVTATCSSIYVNKNGILYGYIESSHSWETLGTLTFYKIEFPDELTSTIDGFYTAGSGVGTISDGHLGSGIFEFDSASVLNSEPTLVNVDVEVFRPGSGTAIYTAAFTNLPQGSLNYKPVVIDSAVVPPADTSPTIDEIETISGVTFSTTFRSWLSSKSLTSIDTLRKAGPINYINGFPSGAITSGDLAVLQGHVDFYTINRNAEENQLVIDAGYTDSYKVATTPRDIFLNEVITEGLPLFTGAQFQQTASQNLKLSANMTAATLVYLGMADSPAPVDPDSFYVSTALSNSTNSCGCDDCQSNVSPFAYLMDLIKYAAQHVYYSASPTYNPSQPLSDFVTLLSNKFLQPFGTLKVDCETLHDTYCRVRLVTEVLEKQFDIKFPSGLASLTTGRKEYLSLTYQLLLNAAGTSLSELRDVVSTQPLADKIIAAQKLSDRLGVPLYVPTTSTFIADRIYLTFNGGSVPLQDLTAANIEAIFGFRNTELNVLLPTPVAYLKQWREAYLRDRWYTQDYLLTAYSREGVIPATDATFKTNWRPIVDPDIMGWEDMTYLTSTDNSAIYPSRYSKALWTNRKEDTDSFLNDCFSFQIRTSADINERILRVSDRNIVNHVMELDEVKIETSTGPSVWTTYEVSSKKLTGFDTDVVLKKSTPAVSQPAMLQPVGTSPQMRYRRIVSVVSISGSTSITLSWPTTVIEDPLSGGYAKLESNGIAYETGLPGGDPLLLSMISFNTALQQVTFTLGSAPSPTFLAGNIKFTYEVEVPLYTTTTLYPKDVVNDLFVSRDYTLLTPAPSGLGATFPYSPWIDTDTEWAALAGTTNYDKLSSLQQLIAGGVATSEQLALVGSALKMTMHVFNRMTTLLSMAESYRQSMYTLPALNKDELSELVSVFRASGKTWLYDVWVKEEIKYVGSGSSPVKIMLDGRYFWKTVFAPVTGRWDPTLQTIPDTTGAITDTDVPIVDPELLSLSDILVTPEAAPYRTLYGQRQVVLDTQFNTYLGLIVPYSANGYTEILNQINTGSTGTAYSIAPYTSLTDLMSDLTNLDVIKQKAASDTLWTAFRINREDFLIIANIKTLYELNDPVRMPVMAELKKSVKLLVSGFKRKRRYRTNDSITGWIETEITATSLVSIPTKYYNVLKMKMAPGRSEPAAKAEWQRTLSAWNRKPFVQPDIVPPENVKTFTSGNVIYTTWNTRNNLLITAAGSSGIGAYINSSVANAGAFFTNFKEQLNLIIARVDSFVPLTGPPTLAYLHYFTDLKTFEDNREDIRPFLTQLGITISEYRYLQKIYQLLQQTSSGAAIPLLDYEYKDIIDILIAIRSRNITFGQVLEEFDANILLDQDFFKLYRPNAADIQNSQLVPKNTWRQSNAEIRNWQETLETRIDREKAVNDKWSEALFNVEDRTMPMMRDALIRALTDPCESFDEAAERLARTFFIETKDNCCVKHTRVSFAIETVQGLLFALQNGIYDDYVANFSLTAPDFDKEWLWIGSYASWRSALLTFIYPENLLYPTLKRSQSPGFTRLAERLQSANKSSPKDACAAAAEFQEYLADVEGMQIVCTANANVSYIAPTPFDCCSTSPIASTKLVVYYIGQGISGKAYWSSKIATDNSKEAHGFWEPLPIEGKKDLKVIGAFVIADRGGNNWIPIKKSLFVYYTYTEESALKMAYISKDLFKAGSDWLENETQELPKYLGIYAPRTVTACQTRMDWMPQSFIFSYEVKEEFTDPFTGITEEPTKYVHIHGRFDHRAKAFNTSATDINTFRNDFEKPVTAIHMEIFGSVDSSDGLIVVFDDKILTAVVGNNTFNTWGNGNSATGVREILGAYESRIQQNTVIVTYIDLLNVLRVKKLSISTTSNPSETAVTAIAEYTQMRRIFPVFSERDVSVIFAIDTGIVPFSTELIGPAISGTQSIALSNVMALTPEPYGDPAIQSAECIDYMGDHQSNIRFKMKYNMNWPQGGSDNYILRTTSVYTLLWEAYYFVPMLLGLDQQSHGQFESALSWYRSVYDYTASALTMRKIFYGLKMEESITNSFAYASNWLLDPLNPHLIAQSRVNAYTKYTLMSIIQCLNEYADQQFTMDTVETVPVARKLYSTALDLLKCPELELQNDSCAAAATCLDVSVSGTLPVVSTWSGVYSELRESLINLGDASVSNSLVTPIAALINAGTETTYAAKFAESFELIATATPTPSEAKTVDEVVSGYGARNNDMMRYVSSQQDVRAFNEVARDRYAVTISGATQVPIDKLDDTASLSRLNWLKTTVPSNSTPVEFSFATSEGEQIFTGDWAFDPTAPTDQPLWANQAFDSLPFIVNQNNMVPIYIPLIDYNFCMPKNPVYRSLQLKSNLELFKIFNCRNIAGIVRELDVFSAPTDSTTGIPVIGASGNLTLPGNNNFSPSNYRFKVLLERAKQVAQQAQQMESMMLAAFEKEDAENYNQLLARQGLETARATVKLQDLRITQAVDERTTANLQLNKVRFVEENYTTWLASRQNEFEIKSIDLLKESIAALDDAKITQLISAGIYTAAGIGYQIDLNVGQSASSFAQAAGAIGSVYSTISAIASVNASIAAQSASYLRREQEWTFQKDLAGKDIEIANQQVVVAEDNIRIVTQEREIAQLNTSHAESSLDFLKNKFTNAELYNYMGNVLEKCYSYMLNLSTAIARTAEGQLYFERQEQAGPFILNDYWNSPSSNFSVATNGSTTDRRGLTGSARLLVDITRLEQYAFDTLKRKLQMTKTISLAQNFPTEFQTFKETGILNFELTNKRFDYDFPGHYLRLISNVRTTVVGLLPVYDGIKASLSGEAISYTVVGGTTFQKIPIRRMEVDSVALTSPLNATGMFEMQPVQNELLNPFEGMGIESRWEFKMPQFSNRTDFSNISDVIVNIDYTALDSFQYRNQVLQELDNRLEFNRGFSLKNNFPDQWYELGEAQDGTPDFGVTFDLKREMFPQGIENLRLDGTDIVLYFARENGFTEEIDVLDFNLQNAGNLGGGETMNGQLSTTVLMNNIGANDSPLLKLRLLFENRAENRELFSTGKIKDVLLLLGCKADLKAYPLN